MSHLRKPDDPMDWRLREGPGKHFWFTRAQKEVDNLFAADPTGDPFIDDAVKRARESISALHQMSRSAEHDISTQANGGLAVIARDLTNPYRNRSDEQPRFLGLGSRLESWLSATKSTLLPPRIQTSIQSRFGHWWTVVALALTAITAILIVAGNYLAALAVLAGRVLTSLAFSTPGLRADVSVRNRGFRVSWAACVTGHLSDSVIFTAVGLHLSLAGRPAWGAGLYLVGVLAVLSTLGRVAALQDGHWMPRLYLERVLRLGGFLLGLALASMWPGQDGVVPALAISGVGGLVFVLAETGRTAHYQLQSMRSAASRDARYVQRLAAMALAVDNRNTAPIESEPSVLDVA